MNTLYLLNIYLLIYISIDIFYKIVTLNTPISNKGISHFTIVKILKKFTVKEMNELEKMLISPFFNNHTTLIKLFSELKKYYPLFEDNNITKEYLFQAVNKGKKYDDKLFRKYLSRLSKLAEEYFNILQMRLEKESTDFNILRQLSARDLNDVYAKKLNEVEKAFEKNDKIDADTYFNKHLLYTIKYNHETTVRNVVSKNEYLLGSYDNMVNYFLFFTSSFISQIDANQYSYIFDNNKYPLNLLTDSKSIEKFVGDLKKNQTPESRSRIFFMEIILNDMKMNSAENGLQAFRELKNLVFKNPGKLSDTMLYYLLQRMNVFCILESVKGINDMNREIFDNYRMLLERNLFNNDKTAALSLLDFRMILSSAMKNNEIHWAEKFISEKINLLKEDIRLNTRHYGYAVLAFHKKNYSDALNQISKIKSESQPITVDIYILKLKIFYMLGHLDSAVSVADSFRHYITGNNHISDFHKLTHMNFIKYYKNILRLTLKPDKQKIKKLLTEIELSINTKEKKWMKETTAGMLSDH